MANQGVARLAKELKLLETKPVAGVTFEPNETDGLEWTAHIVAPDEYSTPTETRQSPYRGRKFPVKLRFPANYPFKCPDVAFAADMMWHPQVEFKTGSVCAQDLEKMWGPTKMAADVAKFIREFLAHPSLDAAVEADAARDFRENIKDFEKKATAAAAKAPVAK